MTEKEAEAALAASKAKAEALGCKVSIAAVDDHGDLVALLRLDGTRHLMADIARGKALASAIFEAPSGTLAEVAAGSMAHQHIDRLTLNRMFFVQGGLPAYRAGQLLGAIGVSGAHPAQDEEIALAGQTAIGS